MTTEPTTLDSSKDEAEAGRYASPRGRFQVFADAQIMRPPAPDQVTDTNVFATADTVECSALLENHDEQEVKEGLTEMIKALTPGLAATPLFFQLHPDGMSLVHAWFGPNLQLMRHSHPVAGDCLYYVLAGEMIMGNKTLRAGDGFFVPNGMPYKFKAGPEGLEVLEFRAGGGTEGAPGLKIDESSLDTVKKITETAKENHQLWASPPEAATAGSLNGG